MYYKLVISQKGEYGRERLTGTFDTLTAADAFITLVRGHFKDIIGIEIEAVIPPEEEENEE